MTGFSWMLVTAALLLVARDTIAVDQNKLAEIVDQIWKKYKGKRMFSMAVSIPEKENMNGDYDIDEVFSTENGDQVKSEIQKGVVYKEGRIVAAKFQATKDGNDIHAEYRVLQNFDTLLNKNYDYDHDLLLFYVLGSPCYHKCTNEENSENIIQLLNQIKTWKHYAVVFSLVSKSKNPEKSATEEQLKEALENLGIKSGLGLKNIFRCVESDDGMECTSCSRINQVAKFCVSEERDSSQHHSRSSLIDTQEVRRDFPSQNSPSTSWGFPALGVNTGGEEGGSRTGMDSGSIDRKGKRRSARGRKRKKKNQSEGLSQRGFGDSDRNPGSKTSSAQRGRKYAKARKVGGRRVGNKRRGKKQESKQTQSQNKKQAKKKSRPTSAATQWNQKVLGRDKKQGEKGKSKQRKSSGQMRRGGKRKRINQPQSGKKQQKWKRKRKG